MSIQELQYWRFQPFRSQSCIWREPCKLFEYMEGELASGTTAFEKSQYIFPTATKSDVFQPTARYFPSYSNALLYFRFPVFQTSWL